MGDPPRDLTIGPALFWGLNVRVDRSSKSDALPFAIRSITSIGFGILPIGSVGIVIGAGMAILPPCPSIIDLTVFGLKRIQGLHRDEMNPNLLIAPGWTANRKLSGFHGG